jgi:hypothetical protein
MMSTNTDLVHDYDFHPDESDVRLFRVPRADVLRLDAGAFVSEAEFSGVRRRPVRRRVGTKRRRRSQAAHRALSAVQDVDPCS